MPLTNGLTHCPTYANSTSCYLLNTTQDTYSAHKSNCAGMGGYLVSYNSAFEQLDVETQLKGLSPDSTVNEWYYIGLEKAGNVWYWLDGGSHNLPPPQWGWGVAGWGVGVGLSASGTLPAMLCSGPPCLHTCVLLLAGVL